jgi:hypothetical protein
LAASSLGKESSEIKKALFEDGGCSFTETDWVAIGAEGR